MPPKCSICTHPKRAAIDRALLDDRGSLRDIARQHAVSKDALHRHRQDHLSGRMAKVAVRNEQADIRTAIDVVTQLQEINAVARTVLQGALASGDGTLALQAIDRVQKQIELQARLIDLIRDGNTINVIVSPQWLTLRSAIIVALEDHPEARQSVAEALHSVEGGMAS